MCGNYKNRIITLIIAVSITLNPLLAFAHPGRTDSYGCHTCRTNCPNWGLSYGDYHCHRSRGLPQPKEPIRSHYGDSGTGVVELWPEYKSQTLTLTIPATSITHTLKRGMQNNQVLRLQQILALYPEIYPEGLVTGYFGATTERAVKRLQQKYGLDQVGYVGPKTRAILNSL